MLCDDLNGQDRGGVRGRLKRKGGICIHIVDSRCCTAEANTTLSSNYPPIKKIIFLKRTAYLKMELYGFNVKSVNV